MWVIVQTTGDPREKLIVAHYATQSGKFYSAWVSHEPDGYHYNSWAGDKHGPFETMQVAIAACEMDGAHHGNKS